MPQIASAISSPPAATVDNSPAPTPGAGSATSASATDAGAADFLGQFKAALKSLTRAVVAPPLTAAQIAAQAAASAEAATASSDASTADAAAGPDKPTDPKLPDLLAALGFALVPLSFAAPTVAAATSGASGPATGATLPGTGAAAGAVATPGVPAALQPPAPDAAGVNLKPADAQAAATDPKPLDLSGVPPPTAAQLNQPDVSALVQSVVPPATPAVPQHAAGAATPGSPALGALAGVEAQSASQAGASSDPGDSPDGKSQSDRSDPKISLTSADSAVQDPAALDPSLAAAAAASTAAAPSSLQAATDTLPAQVVSQIANQADLYSLPGNKSVRIQLHPDDLGGVQVTLRYAPTGGIELHINTDHAATGALVEAGFSQLREALASHGITPDRMLVSVSAPSDASQLNFSGGGSGSRPDVWGTASGQGGQTRHGNQGQSQSGTDDQRGSGGWNGSIDPASSLSADPTSRTAASAAASRIDYRV